MMSEKLFYHVYGSSAENPFSQDELTELLRKSRANNTAANITGMLLYKDGNFMQALEGPEIAVRDLLARIHKDPRHHHILTFDEGSRYGRQFPGWSMAFYSLNGATLKSVPGYSEFLNSKLNSVEFQNPDLCQKLLMVFKQSVR